MSYIDLHVHTKFTKGNSVIEIPDLVQRAKDYGMEALAISDSASVKGFEEFVTEGLKQGIKPILGCGFYFSYNRDNHEDFAHLVLIALNNSGIKELYTLDRRSRSNVINEKPRITYKDLLEGSSNLIALTGGLGGVFDKVFLKGDRSRAYKILDELKNIFGKRLYLEVQDNGLENNRVMAKRILNTSKDLGIDLIISGGSFYIYPSDSIECNKLRKSFNNRSLEGNGYWFKSESDIRKCFSKEVLELDKSQNIGKLCNYEFNSVQW